MPGDTNSHPALAKLRVVSLSLTICVFWLARSEIPSLSSLLFFERLENAELPLRMEPLTDNFSLNEAMRVSA
jgi:hypothetical protein